MSTLQLETPEVFVPLLQPSRYKGAYGGRGSGKSHIFAELLIERCLMRRTRAVCVREVQRSLDQSVKKLLETKIEQMGVGHKFRVTHTHIVAPDDGLIMFNGMQNHTAETIKSLEGCDVAWVEEAQSLSDNSLTLLRPTIRNEDSELWFSWNPRHATDPVDKLLRGKDKPPGAIVVQANYKDNPWFPEVLRQEMEWDRARDIEKYTHVWLGGYERNSEARVFKNFRIEEFDTPDGVTLYYGGDWGFSVDPAVLVRLWIDAPKKRLYIDHEAYKIGCEIDNLPALFATVPQSTMWPIKADSSRPDTISYMRRHGYPRIGPAKKGPNSLKEGVIFLQGYDIIIHPRCVHTADEFTSYSYVVDKLTGIVTPVLEDKKNHVIDSVRYAVEDIHRGRGRTRRTSWG
jgi:phage terminase large subunit